MEIDLALPSRLHTLSASSGSELTIATTPPSTIMTRSMSRGQQSKCDATDTDQEDSKAGRLGEIVAQKKIPSMVYGRLSHKGISSPALFA